MPAPSVPVPAPWVLLPCRGEYGATFRGDSADAALGLLRVGEWEEEVEVPPNALPGLPLPLLLLLPFFPFFFPVPIKGASMVSKKDLLLGEDTKSPS